MNDQLTEFSKIVEQRVYRPDKENNIINDNSKITNREVLNK